MDNHIQMVGILHMIIGGMGLLAGVILFMILGGISMIVGISAPPGDAMLPIGILGAVGFIMIMTTIVSSIPGIIGGYGLLHHNNWARVLTIVISIIYIPFFFPFGTILGIYSLWVLLSKESNDIFNQTPDSFNL